METRPNYDRFDAQLKLLQQRNMEWAQETAAMLDEEVRQAREPLQARLVEMEALVLELERERDALSSQVEQSQALADQRVRALTEQIGRSIQDILGQPAIPQVPAPQSRPVAAQRIHVQAMAAPVRRAVPAAEPPHRPVRTMQTISAAKAAPKPVRAAKRLHRHPAAKSAIGIAIVLAAGYGALRYLPHNLSLSSLAPKGIVAGAATAKPAPLFQSPEQEYPGAYATVSFADTQWATYSDSSFGISMQYPKNATGLVHVVGGENLWFLRGDGYLMKISEIDAPATQVLNDWWTVNQNDYVTDTPASLSTFQGQAAWYIPPEANDANSGSTYFVKHGAEVYEVWVKNVDPGSDDGRRLAQMVASLQFTS